MHTSRHTAIALPVLSRTCTPLLAATNSGHYHYQRRTKMDAENVKIPQGQALIPTVGSHEMVSEMKSYMCGIYDGQPLQMCTTMDVSSPKAKALLANMATGSDLDTDTVMGQCIRVKDFVVFQKPMTNKENGETNIGVVYVLVLDDDTTVSGTSPTVRDCLAAMVRMFGLPPWTEPPLPCKLVESKSAQGHKFHRLAVVPTELP